MNDITVKILHKSSTTSTNDDAFALAEKGIVNVVTADRQTGARGRFSRSFSAEEGGVYLSLCFEADKDFSRNLLLTPLAAVCVCRAIGEETGVSPRIKWCNDVLADGKKVCGILCEMREKSGIPFVTVGVGLNANNPLPKDLPDAASLADITGRDINVSSLRERIADNILAVLRSDDAARKSMMREYKSLCVNIGKRVTATVNGRRTEGLCTDITGTGALVLVTDDGKTTEVFSGEATLR